MAITVEGAFWGPAAGCGEKSRQGIMLRCAERHVALHSKKVRRAVLCDTALLL
jgi:hypothetical protein